MIFTLDVTQVELAERLREAMAQVCTPVSIVTARDVAGARGSTVSAFLSLSMKPPMILVALSRTSDTLAAMRSSGRFDLNVLGSGQQHLAGRFATKGIDKFAPVDWDETPTGIRLHGVASWVSCKVRTMTDGGDHVVVTGLVQDAESRSNAPLTYHRRAFGTHAPLPVR